MKKEKSQITYDYTELRTKQKRKISFIWGTKVGRIKNRVMIEILNFRYQIK